MQVMCQLSFSVKFWWQTVLLLVQSVFHLFVCREVVPDAARMALASGRASGGERHSQGRLVFVRLPGQPR
jgi:hypothetical protein